MTSLNDLAKELGVSRQRIQQIVANLPAAKRPKKLNGKYSVDASTKQIIANKLTNKVAANSQNTDNNNDLRVQLADKQKQIEFLQESLREANKHLDKSQQLADQAQRLQLKAESKVQQLEEANKHNRINTNLNVDHKSIQSNSMDNYSKSDTKNSKKDSNHHRGLFSKLFKN